MSNNFRALNRQILTQFLSNHEAIKAFEQALTDVGTTFPDAIAALEAESSENSQQAGSAFAAANTALAILAEVASGLAAVLLAPPSRPTQPADDLTPPVVLRLVEDNLAPPSDPAGSSATVQVNLTAHTVATGTAVHGLGTASLSNVGDFDAAGAAAAAQAASQPLDSDLTAIAALTTTAYGRALLTLANAAAGQTAFGLGTMSTQNATAVAITGGTATGLTAANNTTVDMVVVTNTTVAALSGANSHWLCIAFDKNAVSAYAIGVVAIQDDGTTMAVVQLAQGGDFSTGWTVSGLNIRLTSNGGGANCRASFLRIR